MDNELMPEHVLVCSVCSKPIDNLMMGMIFWDDDDNNIVTELRIAHKGKCDKHKLSLSMELGWFADPQTALFRLMHLVDAYQWSAEQMKRLVLLAWATPHLASEETTAWARHVHGFDTQECANEG